MTASVLPSPLSASRTPNELYGRALGALMNDCSLHVVPVLNEDVRRADPDVRAAQRRRIVRAPGRIDAGRQARLVARADRDGVPVLADRRRKAEAVARLAPRALDIRLLGPASVLPGEDEQRARTSEFIVVRRIDAAPRAVLVKGRRGQRVAVAAERDGKPEKIPGLLLRGLDVRLLRPCRPCARKHVHRAGRLRRVVFVVAVDLLRMLSSVIAPTASVLPSPLSASEKPN